MFEEPNPNEAKIEELKLKIKIVELKLKTLREKLWRLENENTIF